MNTQKRKSDKEVNTFENCEENLVMAKYKSSDLRSTTNVKYMYLIVVMADMQ